MQAWLCPVLLFILYLVTTPLIFCRHHEPNSEGGLVQNVLSPRQSLRGLIASRLWVIKRYKLGGN